MSNKLMTHVVAGYPTEAQCIKLLLGMQNAGVSVVEVQIPFSDPGADGPVIMKANDIALKNEITTQACFEIISQARAQGFILPVYIMSYTNKVISFGFEAFCKQAQKSEVSGFIIPDLPFNTVEYAALAKSCAAHSIDLVPVVSPGMLADRLSGYKLGSHKLIYATSTQGITGKELVIKGELLELIRAIRAKTSAQIALGFGIRSLTDVERALEIADLAVIGSAVIKKVEAGGVDSATQFIEELVAR